MLLSSKVIQGNTNFYSIKTRDLNPKVTARYLRINPQYWKGWPCLRTDFMGCSKDEGKKTLQADINLYIADSQDNYNESKASRSSERSKRKRKEIKNSKLVNQIKSFPRCQCFIVILFCFSDFLLFFLASPTEPTPLRSYYLNLCLTPRSKNCTPDDNDLLEHASGDLCLESHFQFTLGADGVLRHTCSGKMVCPENGGTRNGVRIVVSSTCTLEDSKFERTSGKK